ncbi:hypothetical protein RRV45_18925 [Bacillus sp. DTU_2020_1000418_1_SI_GHA_SEK_038]|nr:hypothetical protein [Bacillus sp. DTU_2020_1000418_1_SI_GHA_SEK_038]WNS74930.1 hypothetical protein RRV45_18925 [Bacillus sp. DTU_2020_1000418_1_SI_GHA_SEK_038]
MKTIILVDDEPLMLDLLSFYLSPAGFGVLAINGLVSDNYER